MFKNIIFMAPVTAVIFAQFSKVLLILLMDKEWHPGRLTGSGGMPSAHSAMMAALVTSCALEYGLQSAYFAITVIFGLIVIHDAAGVRRATGHHAEILNEIVKEFSHLFEEKKREKALKTLLGHTYPQVIAGCVLGVGVSYALQHIMKYPA